MFHVPSANAFFWEILLSLTHQTIPRGLTSLTCQIIKRTLKNWQNSLKIYQFIYPSFLILECWQSFKLLAKMLFEVYCWQDFIIIFSKEVSQRAYDVKWRRINVDATWWRRIDVGTTSFWHDMPQRAYDVKMTSHRRWYDVILARYARWDNSKLTRYIYWSAVIGDEPICEVSKL